jgi:hypothetical protein
MGIVFVNGERELVKGIYERWGVDFNEAHGVYFLQI